VVLFSEQFLLQLKQLDYEPDEKKVDKTETFYRYPYKI